MITAANSAASTTPDASVSDRGTRRLGHGRKRERAIQWLFVVPALVYIALFVGYPIVENVVMSLQTYTVRTFATGEAPWTGISNYVSVVTGSLFSTALVNTLVFTVGSIAGQFVIGLALALFFNQKFHLNKVLRSLLLLPWLLPLIASAAVWKWILDQDSGVLNQTLLFLHIINAPVPWLSSPDVALISVIIVSIWVGIPFTATILYGGLQDIPKDLYEAASLDGATGWKSFLYITLPNLRVVIIAVLALCVVYTLKALDLILGLTGGGPANATQTLATYAYNKSFVQFNFGTGAAISNILILVSLLFTFVYLGANRGASEE